MKIGIICAGDREIAPFYAHMEEESVSVCAKLRVHEGKICGVPVVLAESSVCKVNAAMAAMVLIERCGVEAIFSGGTAGGMAEEVQLMDTVVMTECAHHDVAEGILTEAHPYRSSIWFKSDEKLLKMARKTLGQDKTVRFGRMVTGEVFITEEGRARINREFAPLSVDMETAAIAQVCEAMDIPFITVRSITDTAAHAGAEHFERNVQAAAERSKNCILRMLECLRA